MRLSATLVVGLALIILASLPAMAAESTSYNLTLKDHVFTPADITVPANKPVDIHIKNLDATAEEFDSDDLNVEKVIPGNSEGVVHLQELKSGTYKFTGEYHEDTAHGSVTAK